MKLLLGTFNLLMSVIIIINFIFIMNDFIKNWFSINSNSCNYKVLSSVEYRTKLFIFKLFYEIVFAFFIAFLISFLVIYKSKFWSLFSVLSFTYILIKIFKDKNVSPSLLNKYAPEILLLSSLLYFFVIDPEIFQAFLNFLNTQKQWLIQMLLILYICIIPFLGMFSLIINFNLFISNIFMIFNSKVECFNIEKVEYLFKTGKIKLTFWGRINYFFKVPFITLINLFYILKIKLARMLKIFLIKLSKYIQNKQIYSIKKMIYISIIFSVSFCYVFIVIYNDFFYDKTIIIYEFFATVILIPIVYDLITKSKN